MVSFTKEIYYDARSYKRQISILKIGKNSRVTDFGLTLQGVAWKIKCNFLQKLRANAWIWVFVKEEHNTENETAVNPYPTAFPYGNGMVLHFYQQQESSTTKTVHKVINKRLKTYV